MLQGLRVEVLSGKALRKAYKKRGRAESPQDWTGGASLGVSHELPERVSGGQERGLPLVWRVGAEQLHSYPLRETGLGTHLGPPFPTPHLGLSLRCTPNQMMVSLSRESLVMGTWALRYAGHWEGKSGLKCEMHGGGGTVFLSVGTRYPAGRNLRAGATGEVKRHYVPKRCPGHLAFKVSLPQLSGAFIRRGLDAGVCAPGTTLCTRYSQGPRGRMCTCVCALVCMCLGHTVRCCLPSSHNCGPFYRWGGSMTTHLYSCPPPSSVSEKVLNPRLATDTCVCWAGVGSLLEGQVLGAE